MMTTGIAPMYWMARKARISSTLPRGDRNGMGMIGTLACFSSRWEAMLLRIWSFESYRVRLVPKMGGGAAAILWPPDGPSHAESCDPAGASFTTPRPARATINAKAIRMRRARSRDELTPPAPGPDTRPQPT